MARKPRIYYPGAMYHAIARGNNKEDIFCDSRDKNKYLELLAKYKEKYGFELFAYVLMNNHIHLLVRVQEHSLSKIMQGIQLTYTQYFNYRYSRVGHVFEQRYKAFICENQAYLMNLICYIHQNPVRANMDGGINYPWSSHQHYNHGKGGLVNLDFILDLLHEDRRLAISIYRELVAAPVIIDDFEIKEKAIAADLATHELPLNKSFSNEKSKMTLVDLAENLSLEHYIEVEEMLSKCRVRKVVRMRNQFIFEAINRGLASKAELANLLELDPARITHVYQEMLDVNANKSIFQ